MSSVPRDERPLGGWSLLALGLNGVIGVGIFFTPGLVAGFVPGLRGAWVYALTAVVLGPVAAVYATLGRRFDSDGGPYIWARAAFGAPAAFAVGWTAYISGVLSTAAVVAGMGHSLGAHLGIGPSQERLVSLGAGGALVALTALGLQPSARIWSALTIAKIVPLLLLVGAFAWRAPQLPPVAVAALPAEGGWGRAILLAVFALQGFEIVPVPRGHARGGARTVPLATFGALALPALLYAAIQAACVRSLPDAAALDAPLAAAAAALGGGHLGRIVALGTDVSAIGIAFGMAAMTPRYLVALSSDETLGPTVGPWLRAENRGQVPARALALTGLAIGVLVAGRGLAGLFVLSGLAVLIQYAASALALARLAWRRSHGLRRRDAAWAPLSAAAVLLMLRAAQPGELAILSGVMVVGLALWLLGQRARA
jgi:amino acid transporter